MLKQLVNMRCMFLKIQFILVVSILTSLFSVNTDKSFAFELDETSFSLTGFLRQEAAVGTSSDSAVRQTNGKLVSAYSTLWVEPDWNITPELNLHATLNFMGDWAYGINEDKDFWEPFAPSRDNMEHDLSEGQDVIRELTANYAGENFSLVLGKQQMVWGRADAMRVADQMNPLDLRREWILRDADKGYEESRIPLWALKAEGYVPDKILPDAIDDLTVEFNWIPGDIETTRQYLGYNQGGIWGVPLTVLAPINAMGVGVQLEDKVRSSELSNSEFGARVKSNIGPVYTTLFYFNGFQDDFVLKPTGFVFGGEGLNTNGGLEPFPVNFKFDQEYPRKQDFGLTLNYEIYGIRKLLGTRTNPVLRAEMLYELDKPFNTRDWALYNQEAMLIAVGAMPGHTVGPDSAIEERDQFRGMLGLDWPFKVDWLNSYKAFWCSVQYFGFHTEGDTDNLQYAPFPWDVHKYQDYLSVVMTTEYFHGMIKPAFAWATDLKEGAGFVKAYLDFEIGDHWRPSIGYMGVYKGGDSDANFRSFGIFDEVDQVYASVKYQF